MATFDDTQKAKLIKILRVNPITLSDRLDYYASNITNEMKTEVETLIDEWEAGTTARNNVQIFPTATNKGAKISPDELRNAIKGELAELLFCADLIGGGFQIPVTR